MTLIPLAGAMAPSQTAIIAPTPRAKGAKPEEIYRAWLELAEQRISAEQVLIGGHTVQPGEAASTTNGALWADVQNPVHFPTNTSPDSTFG